MADTISSQGDSTSLSLISYAMGCITGKQRVGDANVSATELCKAGGKLFNDDYRNEATPEFLDALILKTRISAFKLVESRVEAVDFTWLCMRPERRAA
jgi:hypothetical protein